jgi:hypothetical protein
VKYTRESKVAYAAAKAKLDAANAQFAMRCKTAGEKIHRTVDGVEGVVWMRWRPKGNSQGQFALDDPYGKDCSGEGCIERLLRVTKGRELNPKGAKSHDNAYSFVETTDPTDGQRYRYIGAMKPCCGWTKAEIEKYKKDSGKDTDPDIYRLTLERQPINQFTARYAITWEDVSTPEDRKYWVAGNLLKVIDLQTNEVIAERIGYLIDTGQGSTAGFRDPWGWAQTYAPRCPSIDKRTWDFSIFVLHPINQGN